ncbi:MAG: GIY-YIG nuclease family protein [Alphaproteobacteria bacterium]
MREYGGFTYMLASQRNGTLYTGVTNNLIGCVWRHRQGTASSFTAKYNVTRLVWFEPHAFIGSAIQSETSIKRWPRMWKLALIEKANAQWRDLYEDILRSRELPDWAQGAEPLEGLALGGRVKPGHDGPI